VSHLDLDDVVRGGLCTGCGLCESIAGRDVVAMTLSPGRQLRPRVRGRLEPAVADAIEAVCPGVRVTGPAGEPGIPVDPVWGPIASLERGWSADAAIRHRAAAGGALSTLAVFLLESGRVDAILHVRADPDRPLETVAHVSRSRAEVLAGSQSRYGPAAPLVHVHALLAAGDRFAVVAKPCDVAAVRALQRQDDRARTQIPVLLTLFCGGAPSVGMAEQVVASHDVAVDEVTTFRFRGEGWPGPMRTETRDGRRFDVDYDTAWYTPGVPWRYDMQFRCKLCPDAIGEVADVACPDGWALEDGRPIHREAEGVNLVIARTAVGRRLVDDARAAGYLVTAPCSREELDAMHRDHHPRRLSAPARALGLRLAGQRTLSIRGYRTLVVTRRAGLRRTASALAGAFRRARAGSNREPPA
jgi:coenzyme F420 hydrogenase subunit beta